MRHETEQLKGVGAWVSHMTPAGLFARRFEPLDRVVQLGVAGGKVIDVSFPDSVPDDAAADHAALDRLEAYLDGETAALSGIEYALTVPTDRRSVLESLGTVPPGETVTVSRLARLAGLAGDGSEATVRDALRENPVPIVLPDHRVRDGQGATPPNVAAALRRLEN